MTIDIRRRTILLGVAACTAKTPAQTRPTKAAHLIAAARQQVGVTLNYDPAYTRLPFPNGDVARDRGVCTDVLVRAYRDAFGLDLQALLNADMRAGFTAYPARWGLRAPDTNIDHRRVPNLQTFLARQRAVLELPDAADGWRPGDLFTSLIGGTLPHIGIVSDRRSNSGRPLVIHNINSGAREEDALFDHRLTGRYRWRLES